MNKTTYRQHQVKCTCPRGRYSAACPIQRHRDMAREINSIFGINQTLEERLQHIVWGKGFARGLYCILVGFLLAVIGNTIRQVVTSEPPIPEIIHQQTGK